MADAEKKVLICGGRGWGGVALYLEGTARTARAAEAQAEREFLSQAMDELDQQLGPFTHVINGGAKGADTYGSIWGDERGKKVTVVRANWDTYGRSAGPIRNQEIIDLWHPDVVIAFAGGKGTIDMLGRALKTEALVIQFRRFYKGGKRWQPVRLSSNGQ